MVIEVLETAMPHRDSVAPSTDAVLGIDPLDTLDAAGLSPIIKRKASTIKADVSRRPHTLPPFIRLGSRTLWLKTEVANWLRKKQQEAVAPGKAGGAGE
jgi:hypothetical protein